MDHAVVHGERRVPAGRRLALRADFVGRTEELARLERLYVAVAQGGGGVVAIAGEAGIGKTRLVAELLLRAREKGALVLSGTCTEGATGGAYAPFRLALTRYVDEVAESTLRVSLGDQAGVIAQLVPRVHGRIHDVTEPVGLRPDEEHTRLLDAISRWLIAIAARQPLVLVLDDLHWADDDTLMLLRHLGRMVSRHRILILASYREHEVEAEGTLSETLAVLRRQPDFERIKLGGLTVADIEALLQSFAAQRSTAWSPGPVETILTRTIQTQTNGNPFFVRALVLHLEEEGQLFVQEGRWRAATALVEIGLPDGVRPLLLRRLGRLTDATQTFLGVAAVVGATFRFDVVATVAELTDEEALAAVDEALAAQLIEPALELDSYAFVHALVRQCLCETLNPSRQVRLHRLIAAAMERRFGDRADEYAGEIAQHYHRSRTLPGAEQGIIHALHAADRAERTAAHVEVATFLRMALDLMRGADPGRADLLGRLAFALAWCQRFDEAIEVADEASDLMAARNRDQAADYLAEIIGMLWKAGSRRGRGLLNKAKSYLGDRRDRTWVEIMVRDIVSREADDPTGVGIPLDTPERAAVTAVIRDLKLGDSRIFWLLGFDMPRTRAEAIARVRRDSPDFRVVTGMYRSDFDQMEERAARLEAMGALGEAGGFLIPMARHRNTLGDFVLARAALDRAAAIAARIGPTSALHRDVTIIRYEMCRALDRGWRSLAVPAAVDDDVSSDTGWLAAAWRSSLALISARFGNTEQALGLLRQNLPALERAAGSAFGYPMIACEAAITLWFIESTCHLEAIEQCLREKVLAPDFRWPMLDARHSLACLCALRGSYEEAGEWFAAARTVLEEQASRPLRAITDYDEALMYARRGAAGDRERAQPLLDAALTQFGTLGMPGWIRRAEVLAGDLQHAPGELPTAPITHTSATAAPVAPVRALFRKEGDFWTLTYDGITVRLKSSRGMRFLSLLLQAPGVEIVATDLVDRTAPDNGATVAGPERGDAGEHLDAAARAAYKQPLRELRDELTEAEELNDAGRSERLRTEIDFLTAELARAVGLGGRARRSGSRVERARVNVTRTIALALRRIAAQHPALGAHLARTVRTGIFCSYNPDPRAPIEWQT